MEAKELQAQLDILKTELEKVTDAKSKSAIDAEIKKVNDEIAKLAKADDVTKMQGTVNSIEEKLNKVIEAQDKMLSEQKHFNIGGKHKDAKQKDFGEEVSGRIITNIDYIKSMGKGQWKALSVDKPDQKAAGTMTTANIDAVGTNSIPYLLSDDEMGLTRIARRKPFLMQLCNVGATNKMYVQWAEQTNPDPGVAGMTAEGAAKTQTDFDVQERSQKVEKVTAYIKVSTEMLDDVDFMRSEINQELVELLMLKACAGIYNGNGTTPNLKGILEYAPGVSFGGLNGTVTDANRLDVLRAAYAQIATNQFTTPTEIVLHPEDAASLDLEKGTNGHYLMPPFSTNERTTVKGVRVVENTLVTAGNFLIGDFNKSNVRIRKALSVSVGYENDDFTKNLVTILAEMRLVHYIKANHANAFVYDSFADGIAALDQS